MAFTVYPVGSSSGFSEESELDSDLHRLMHAFGGRLDNFVVDPFNSNHFNLTNPSGLDAQVASGDAVIGGHLVRMDSAVTKTLNASVTSEIFLVVDDAETNNAAIVAQDKPTADPTGQYVEKLWEATTDGSTITGTTDFRHYVGFRGDTVATGLSGRKTGSYTGAAIDSNGVFTVSVTFTNPYIDGIDTVLVSLNDLTASQPSNFQLGYLRAKNYAVDGFDIEYNVANSASAGDTADFNWVAHGR